jgi:RNase P/RNase MRP subunit POP5
MTNNINREELTQAYIDRVIDNMNTKDLVRIVWEQLEENLGSYTDEELISEVSDYYPELLEEDA